jgi:hypothetical protein
MRELTAARRYFWKELLVNVKEVEKLVGTTGRRWGSRLGDHS